MHSSFLNSVLMGVHFCFLWNGQIGLAGSSLSEDWEQCSCILLCLLSASSRTSRCGGRVIFISSVPFCRGRSQPTQAKLAHYRGEIALKEMSSFECRLISVKTEAARLPHKGIGLIARLLAAPWPALLKGNVQGCNGRAGVYYCQPLKDLAAWKKRRSLQAKQALVESLSISSMGLFCLSWRRQKASEWLLSDKWDTRVSCNKSRGFGKDSWNPSCK